MFGIGSAKRTYLAAGSKDMCKSSEGVFGLVHNRLSCDPLGGHIFLFSNAQRNRLKLLFWCARNVWRRAGSSGLKQKAKKAGSPLSYEEHVLRLGGIDLAQTRRQEHRVNRAA